MVLLVFILSVGRIFVANRLVESSDKLRKMDAQILALEAQNQSLSQEVRHLESSGVVEQNAVKNGFSFNSHFAVFTPAPEMAYGIIQ